MKLICGHGWETRKLSFPIQVNFFFCCTLTKFSGWVSLGLLATGVFQGVFFQFLVNVFYFNSAQPAPLSGISFFVVVAKVHQITTCVPEHKFHIPGFRPARLRMHNFQSRAWLKLNKSKVEPGGYRKNELVKSSVSTHPLLGGGSGWWLHTIFYGTTKVSWGGEGWVGKFFLRRTRKRTTKLIFRGAVHESPGPQVASWRYCPCIECPGVFPKGEPKYSKKEAVSIKHCPSCSGCEKIVYGVERVPNFLFFYFPVCTWENCNRRPFDPLFPCFEKAK